MPTVELNKLYRCAWADPAGGPQARTGKSRSAIVVVGQDDLERIFILEADAGRWPTDHLERRILQTQQKWHPAKFGIDATGPQVLFADVMRRKAREEGVKMNLLPTALRSDKSFSIETTLQPIVAQGRLFRPELALCKTLYEEWKHHPSADFNDTMDALACAIRLLPTALPDHIRKLSKEQFRSYLLKSGMSREKVEERVMEHDPTE